MPSLPPTDRRVWRLAFLLTANPDAASTLVSILPAPRHDAIEPAILDRTIIQNARSLPRADAVNLSATPLCAPVTLTLATDALAAAHKLPRQPLEAWILKRIDDLDDLHIARAMDCSKTAARTHLAAADEAMALRLADRLPSALAALRDYIDSLDPTPLIAAHRHRRKIRRANRLKIAAGLIAAALLLVTYITLRIILESR